MSAQEADALAGLSALPIATPARPSAAALVSFFSSIFFHQLISSAIPIYFEYFTNLVIDLMSHILFFSIYYSEH